MKKSEIKIDDDEADEATKGQQNTEHSLMLLLEIIISGNKQTLNRQRQTNTQRSINSAQSSTFRIGSILHKMPEHVLYEKSKIWISSV